MRRLRRTEVASAFGALFEQQCGMCAICAKTLACKVYPAVVDHRHETGRIRGLLHSDCNIRLGHVESMLRGTDLPARNGRLDRHLQAGTKWVADCLRYLALERLVEMRRQIA